MEKPILFNTEMIKAILDGRKTQTRRIIKDLQPLDGDGLPDKDGEFFYCEAGYFSIKNDLFNPHIQVGDILWVRETWYYENHMHDLTAGEPDLSSGGYSHRYIYKASNPNYPVHVGVGQQGWRPSIHMPKEACRLRLKVTDVRVERLQDIDVASCVKEGVDFGGIAWTLNAKPAFIKLWDSINIDRGYGWDSNPWVWTITFEIVKG